MFKQTKKNIWIGVGVISVLLMLLNFYIQNNVRVNIITAVLGSIIASIVISIFYNDELHSSLSLYKKIGLNEYYENFEVIQDQIRIKIAKAKIVDIYVIYADRFFGGSSLALKSILSRKDSKLRIFLYNDQNLFLQAYGNQWGNKNNDSKYDVEGLKTLISQVKKELIGLYKEIDENNRGILEIYEILDAPVSHSFYKIDSELFYVPSKNTKFKSFKLPVFLFKDTKDEKCMFSKIESEINTMINNNELKQIF
jgi:hypothetical protein